LEEIKKIYLGLPVDLTPRVFWVGRNYRTNVLSHKPGGGDIIVEYHSGKVLGYDWIKFPSRYVSNIFIRQFSKVNENFETFKQNVQLGIIKKEVSRLFARVYEQDEFEKVKFEEIWNSNDDEVLPWDKLKEFEETKYKERNERQKQQRVELKMVAEQKAEYSIKSLQNLTSVENEKFPNKIDLSKFTIPAKKSNDNFLENDKKNVQKTNRQSNKTIQLHGTIKPNKNINSLEHLLPKEIVDKLNRMK